MRPACPGRPGYTLPLSAFPFLETEMADPRLELILKHQEAANAAMAPMQLAQAEIARLQSEFGEVAARELAVFDATPREDDVGRGAAGDRLAEAATTLAFGLERAVPNFAAAAHEYEAHTDMVNDRLTYAPRSTDDWDKAAVAHIDAIDGLGAASSAAYDTTQHLFHGIAAVGHAFPQVGAVAPRLQASLARVLEVQAPLIRLGEQARLLKAP